MGSRLASGEMRWSGIGVWIPWQMLVDNSACSYMQILAIAWVNYEMAPAGQLSYIFSVSARCVRKKTAIGGTTIGDLLQEKSLACNQGRWNKLARGKWVHAKSSL